MSDDRETPLEGRRLRVLVVDDDALSTSVQSQLLQLLGHEVLTSLDGRRAIDMALSERFDVMLLDLAMPDMDGFAVLQALRARERDIGRGALPVIAVTGYVAPEDRARCLAAGFAEHLTKPVKLSRMQEAIEHASGITGAATRPGESAAGPASDVERLREAVEKLRRLTTGESGFAPTVTEAFALRSAQLIETARSAIEDRERTRAVRAAMALRANAQFLGATTLSASASALAEHCQAGDWAAALAGLREFEQGQQAALTVLFQIEH